MSGSKITIALIMQRRVSPSRWQSEMWEPWAVLSDPPDQRPRLLRDDGASQQWVYPGMEIVLHRDECEGYWLNLSSPEPRIFVKWSLEDGRCLPEALSVDYGTASRWLDAGAQADSVAIGPELLAWLWAYVESNYHPEPKKRVRSQSFRNPSDRIKEETPR